MREIRPSGSEGGARFNPLTLFLSDLVNELAPRRNQHSKQAVLVLRPGPGEIETRGHIHHHIEPAPVDPGDEELAGVGSTVGVGPVPRDPDTLALDAEFNIFTAQRGQFHLDGELSGGVHEHVGARNPRRLAVWIAEHVPKLSHN